MTNMPQAQIAQAPDAMQLIVIRCLSVFQVYTRVFFVALLMVAGLSAHARGPASRQARLETGLVTYVTDGDTIWVKTNAAGKPLKVRLIGIDAPELCQTGGVQSRDSLRQRLQGQTVRISYQRHDDYGRALANVNLRGEDIGRWMVGNGQAWSHRFRRSKGPYATEEAQARRARRGIFGTGDAENPRSFRQRHGSCYQADNGG